MDTIYIIQQYATYIDRTEGDEAGHGFAKFLRGVTRLSNAAKGDGGGAADMMNRRFKIRVIVVPRVFLHFVIMCIYVFIFSIAESDDVFLVLKSFFDDL